MSIAKLLEDRRVCVCAGPGGVGKTTVSAAVAVGMAARGRKVAVVTIDPAKRLANALGLEQLDNEPRLIEAERLPGVTLTGALWAMTLDPKRTFDELIDSVAPTPERAGEIKANRIYLELSTAVAGSQEFTAVSKLYDLAHDDRFDLLVLDTPPASNALDFLDAPARLSAFLEGGALQAFLRPRGTGMRLLSLGLSPLMTALQRVTGVDLISELTAFFGLLGDMTDAFSTRARHVEALLRSTETGFLIVTSAERRPVEEALKLRSTLRDRQLPFAGSVVNRLHPSLAVPAEIGPDLEQTLTPTLGGPLAAQVAAAYGDYCSLGERDAAGVRRLADGLGDEPLLRVPEFDDDVHDVTGLLAVERKLF